MSDERMSEEEFQTMRQTTTGHFVELREAWLDLLWELSKPFRWLVGDERTHR